jgi:low affinity Fe/Cu permease
LRVLSDTERHRYRGLETLSAEIRENYQSLDASSQSLLDEVVSKLDFLISFYLRMRYSVARYEAYFQTTDPERIRHRLASLEREMSQGPERVRAIKAKTSNVLRKRLERYEKALENRQLVDAQTETVLEVMQLLRDQSFSMRDPKTITEQLDGLVTSAEETERGVKDLEELLASDQDLFLPGSLAAEDDEELRAVTPKAATAPPVRLPSPAPASNPPPDRKKVTH